MSGRRICNHKLVIFKLISRIDIFGIYCELALRWMPQDFTNIKSTLVQEWLGAMRQQTITWARVDPDLCRHMAILGHNMLIEIGPYDNFVDSVYWHYFNHDIHWHKARVCGGYTVKCTASENHILYDTNITHAGVFSGKSLASYEFLLNSSQTYLHTGKTIQLNCLPMVPSPMPLSR